MRNILHETYVRAEHLAKVLRCAEIVAGAEIKDLKKTKETRFTFINPTDSEDIKTNLAVIKVSTNEITPWIVEGNAPHYIIYLSKSMSRRLQQHAARIHKITNDNTIDPISALLKEYPYTLKVEKSPATPKPSKVKISREEKAQRKEDVALYDQWIKSEKAKIKKNEELAQKNTGLNRLKSEIKPVNGDIKPSSEVKPETDAHSSQDLEKKVIIDHPDYPYRVSASDNILSLTKRFIHEPWWFNITPTKEDYAAYDNTAENNDGGKKYKKFTSSPRGTGYTLQLVQTFEEGAENTKKKDVLLAPNVQVQIKALEKTLNFG